MNPIPLLLLILPKKHRRFAYFVLFMLTTGFGILLIIPPLSQGNLGQAFTVFVIIGLFLIAYWHGWKQAGEKAEG